MKLVLTEGCICNSLIIDDKEAMDYSNDELKEIIKKVLGLVKSKFNLTTLLEEIIEIFDCDYDDTADSKVNTNKYGLVAKTRQNDVYIITVDGKNIDSFAEDEIRDVIKNIVSTDDDNANLMWILRELIQSLGKYKFCYHCEECGDNVIEYKLKI